MTGTNLLPRHRATARRLQRCISAWALALCSLSILVGGGVLAAFATRARPPAMPAGLTQRAETIEASLADLRARVRTLEGAEHARSRASASLRWGSLLDVIVGNAGEGIRLRSINVQPRPGGVPSWSLSITGDANSRATAAELAARLDETGLFESVRHGMTPLRSTSGRPEFSIDCVIAPKAAEKDTP
ncbi:MAG: hypothetical protein RIE77_04810 [Phycisphaerales bacterium]|jgi:hypothetical protein